MISHQYKCIFIEVPKTGSTSIRKVIGNPDKPHLDIVQTRTELETQLCNHYKRTKSVATCDTDDIRRLVESTFLNYFKFGFVRNPWDRTVSLYLRKEGVISSNRMTFDEFVDWINYSSDTCLHPAPHKNQLDWFTDNDGNVVVDFIGRFERLAEDWGFITSKLGINIPLPHANYNMSKTRHYTEYYSDLTRDMIARKFHVDIEYFGYEYGG